MIKKLGWLVILFTLPFILLSGCGELGKVDQGRVIKFDKTKRTVTIVKNINGDYQLPPVTYELPTDPKEMGPEPKVGMRLKLDTINNKMLIFDAATQNLKTVNYRLIEKKENVGKEDPLVYDKRADKPKDFPVVDRAGKTITVYSKKQKILVTFSLPDEYFALPDNTWGAGDEVRIYYKEEGKAGRFMNVSKTDIFKK
ncbi:MAG: DUF4881 domain-containing protein [Syntrophales bacterium]